MRAPSPIMWQVRHFLKTSAPFSALPAVCATAMPAVAASSAAATVASRKTFIETILFVGSVIDSLQADSVNLLSFSRCQGLLWSQARALLLDTLDESRS